MQTFLEKVKPPPLLARLTRICGSLGVSEELHCHVHSKTYSKRLNTCGTAYKGAMTMPNKNRVLMSSLPPPVRM